MKIPLNVTYTVIYSVNTGQIVAFNLIKPSHAEDRAADYAAYKRNMFLWFAIILYVLAMPMLTIWWFR